MRFLTNLRKGNKCDVCNSASYVMSTTEDQVVSSVSSVSTRNNTLVPGNKLKDWSIKSEPTTTLVCSSCGHVYTELDYESSNSFIILSPDFQVCKIIDTSDVNNAVAMYLLYHMNRDEFSTKEITEFFGKEMTFDLEKVNEVMEEYNHCNGIDFIDDNNVIHVNYDTDLDYSYDDDDYMIEINDIEIVKLLTTSIFIEWQQYIDTDEIHANYYRLSMIARLVKTYIKLSDECMTDVIARINELMSSTYIFDMIEREILTTLIIPIDFIDVIYDEEMYYVPYGSVNKMNTLLNKSTNVPYTIIPMDTDYDNLELPINDTDDELLYISANDQFIDDIVLIVDHMKKYGSDNEPT